MPSVAIRLDESGEADDEGDDMDGAERAALDASIGLALEAVRAGRVRAAADVVAELRAKR